MPHSRREDPPGEVIEPAAPAGTGLFAPVGVGGDQDLDALVDECLDRVVLPVASVTEHKPRRVIDAGSFELLAGGARPSIRGSRCRAIRC